MHLRAQTQRLQRQQQPLWIINTKEQRFLTMGIVTIRTPHTAPTLGSMLLLIRGMGMPHPHHNRGLRRDPVPHHQDDSRGLPHDHHRAHYHHRMQNRIGRSMSRLMMAMILLMTQVVPQMVQAEACGSTVAKSSAPVSRDTAT